MLPLHEGGGRHGKRGAGYAKADAPFWRKYQPVIFTAILIGFPLSNVLLFLATQTMPLVRAPPK
jgi:hypothetical protein